MSGFVIGAPAVDEPPVTFPEVWVPLRIRTPIDGAVYEPIQSMSQSLGGATILNRKAIMRRWNLQHAMVDHAGWVNLMAMFQRRPRYGIGGVTVFSQFGSLWFYDAAAPSTTPREFRGMSGWVGTAGPVTDGGITKQITAAAGVTYSWTHLTTPDVAKLLPVVEGDPLTIAVTVITDEFADPDPEITIGVRWYDSAGAFLSSSSTTTVMDNAMISTPIPGRPRCSHVTTVPAGAAYAQPTLVTPTVGGLVITDPTTGPIDMGPAWAVVFIENLQTISHHHNAHQVTLALREAGAPRRLYYPAV